MKSWFKISKIAITGSTVLSLNLNKDLINLCDQSGGTMKIGYFTTRFPYKNPLTGEVIFHSHDGGVENVAYSLAVEMAKRGHEIFIFTSSINSTNSIEDYGKIKIYRYKKNFIIGQAPISLDLLYKPLISDLCLDIVHAHMGNLPAPLTALFFSMIKNKPFIITHHGDWIGGYGGLKRRIGVFLFNNYLCDFILTRTNSIIGLSESHVADSRSLQKYFSKIEVIPNGINLDDFDIPLSKEECRNLLNLPKDKSIILFVGSLTPRKAPDVLLKAMEKIVQESPDSYLVLVGEGSWKNNLKEMAKTLGIDNDVLFTGFIDDDMKILHYKAADVFVLPSLSEAFPLTLMEAAASGLPLVGSGLECFKEIIDVDCNGFLTKTGDYNDLAKKIIYLLNDKELRLKMGANSLNKVKEFSWEKVAQDTEQVYLTLTM
ncbi:glycosyl transferase [Methanosarcina siciliae C2J]|uniref:Glycosyl transferase n=3 Tax=Methanosarcina siciliae TaxID=38027 RepID=A0A0E3P8Z3_9EURY|nr:glycosyl transferase [Methanosarcina siciliae T4/M]AKB38742.1 glycosyl transferase [Methanosarcina siciliae C2J]